MILRKTLAAVTGSCLLLAAGLVAGPLMAGDSVPFELEATVTSQHFEPGKGRVLGTYTMTREGTGTHIGKFTMADVTTLTLTNDGIWFEGSGTIVAADGDEIDLDSWGWTWAPGDAAGSFEITGGTGRFEGATGSGTLTATMGEDGIQTIELEGTIDYKN